MSYRGRRVLDGVVLDLHPGHRLGIVGENGAGKSTLLRLLAGIEEPDGGRLHLPTQLGYLPQELPGESFARTPVAERDTPMSPSATGVSEVPRTVGESVERALQPAREVLRQMEVAASCLDAQDGGNDYTRLLEVAEITQAWDAERRAEVTLAGLGLGAVTMDRTLATLSGGQRARLALAALLIRRPEVLLLDEPTNHLDDAAIAFLEETLRTVRGVVVVASHDRVFLDQICTAIYDLDPARGGYVLHRGSYSDFLRDKQVEREAWQTQFDTEQQQLAQLRVAVRTTARDVSHHREIKDKNKMAYGRRGERVEHQVSRRVRNAQQRLEDLEAQQVRKPPAPLRFAGTGAASAAPAGPLLTATRVSVTGRLAPTSLAIGARERLLVTGLNGSGKSTLLSVLAGRLGPSAGTMTRARDIEVSILEQDVRFPDPTVNSRRIFEALAALRPDRETPDAVELGLLPPAARDRPVHELSQGQRRRIALAVLLARPPHVLLLDEPTNHLSLTLADELQEAFTDAPGAIIVASHDRWLRRGWDGPELGLSAI